MATLKVFTKCGGEIVELNKTAYCDLRFIKNWTKYEGQERFVRAIMAAGVKPTPTNGFEVYRGRNVRFDYLGGSCPKCGGFHFAERQIERPSSPSNHLCDGRCMSARGGKCECSCGGKNHGAN